MEDIQLEQKAIDTLIGRGVEIPLPKWSIIRLLRLNYIYQPYTGTLDNLADVFIKMSVDEEALQLNPIKESNLVVRANAKLVAKAVAISWLNGWLFLLLFTKLFTWYFLWRLKPTQLAQIAIIIRTIMNIGDFINSIRLTSGSQRTTEAKADLVEKKV